MDQVEIINDQQQDEQQNNSNIAILKHPNGSQIYLVGTAHISKQSIKDVIDTIESVNPAIVVLEIDEQRMKRLREAADRYGIQRYQSTSSLQIIGIALSGDLLTYASGLFYAITGALMGTKPGGEFLAAANAAQQLGARVVYADRDQSITMRRLQWYTRQLSYKKELPRNSIESPTFPSPPPPLSSSPPYADTNDIASTTYKEGDSPTWGPIEEDDTSESAIKTRLLLMMSEGGCAQPNAVLAAAQRMLRSGLDPQGSISAQDVAEIRTCGTSLVETFRKRALNGDDSWMKQLEEETVAGAKGALGAQRNSAAMRKVIVDERDMILARRLWEAGRDAAGSSQVVGVVGAGHIKGIEKYWNIADSPAVEERVNEYMRMPAGEGPPSAMGIAVYGSILGYIAYKRPKAMGLFVGAACLMTAPYLGFSVMSLKKLTGFASKLARASEQLEFGDHGVDEDGWMDR